MEKHKAHPIKHNKRHKKNKILKWQILVAVLVLLLIISILTRGFSSCLITKDKTTETITEGNAKGNPDAKVTIIEYSSFSCGYCKRVIPTIDQILQTYPEDVKVIYKHFNRGGTDSQTAQATECAGEQGKFWEMHDEIFASGANGNLETYAQTIGLDTTKFMQCLSSGKYASKVTADTTEGRGLGIGGTPSFVINGELLIGAQPFEAFKQVIDAKLAE